MKKNKTLENRWVYDNDKIVLYKIIPRDVKCSHCINGLDKDCPICHGASIRKKPKWYQLKKRLEYWLENY